MNGATLKQVEKFKYLGVALISDGRQDEELDIRKINKQTNKAGASGTVMRVLLFSVVMKQKIVKNGKALNCKTVFVPILNCDHESWAMTERVRLQVQAFEMRFL